MTLSCLDSIKKHTDTLKIKNLELEIIVVDNGSVDGTVQEISDRFPEVLLIDAEENLGFGKANNIAIEKATGDLLFFLNSDTLLHENTIQSIFKEFKDHKDIGVLGCKLVEVDGSIQKSVRGNPTFAAFLYSDTVFRLLPMLKKNYEAYRQKQFDFSKWSQVDTVMGAAMVIPRPVINKVGAFDPQYFMYFEEADLCRRIKEAGYSIVYSPNPTVNHIGGASSSQARTRMFLAYRQSMLKYFRKHENLSNYILFSLLFKPLFLLDTIFSAILDGLKAILFSIKIEDKGKKFKYKERFLVKTKFILLHSFEFISS